MGQNVPYIYEDYVSVEDTAEAIYKLYSMGPIEREKLGKKARDYVQEEFAMQKTIDLWHESLYNLVRLWKSNERLVPRYEITEF